MTTHLHDAPDAIPRDEAGLTRTAATATLHCLTGCAIGEVLGMVIGTALGWSNAGTVALAVVLAFVFGYSLTMVPLLRMGLSLGVVLPLAFASDSFSIAVMELTDNGIMLAIPGAMDARLSSGLFWLALAASLVVAYVVAFPVNRHLIARGRGHAVVHALHGHGGAGATSTPGAARGFIAMGLASMAATVAIATAGTQLLAHGDTECEQPHTVHMEGAP